MYTMETIKLSLLPFCFYALFLILKENQEINTQGTTIQNNNVVRSTGITEKKKISESLPSRSQNILSLISR